KTSRNDDRLSHSTSCNVNGPSSSRSKENIGLSARNVPCAAMCASPAPSIAASTRAVVADPPASTTGGLGGVVSPRGGPGGWVPPEEKELAEPGGQERSAASGGGWRPRAGA